MKSMFKVVLICGLVLNAIPAYANDQVKIALAKKVITEGEISPYATPNLKNILQKAHKINDQMAKTAEYEGVGCDFAEHFYLGHGNGGLDEITKWKANVLKNGVVRVSFNNGSGEMAYANLVEFDMVQKGNRYAIDDVRFAMSDNPKKIPLGTDSSIKLEAQAMINKNGCTF